MTMASAERPFPLRVLRKLALPVGTTLVTLIVWWAAVEWTDVSPLTLPSPGSVWDATVENRSELASAARVTTVASLVAFAISVIVGILIALVLSNSERLRAIVFPMIVALQAAPKIAIAPLLVVWIGFGREMAIVIGIIVAIFPMIINAITGLTTVDADMRMMAQTMQATRRQMFLRVELPFALPHLFSGMKNCLVLAVVGVVIGELTGANSGLGYVLLSQSGQFRMAYAFAAMILLMLVGLVLFYILEGLEKKTAWYAHDAARAQAASQDASAPGRRKVAA